MYPKIVRVRSGRKKTQVIEYLRLLKKYRDGKGIWKEKVVANLGRVELLGEEIGKLLKSLRRFTDEVLVTPEEIEAKKVYEYGPLVVGKKLFDEIGLPKWVKDACGREPSGSLGVEGVLAMVLNRLIEPQSKLALTEWLEGIYLDGWDFGDGDIKARAQRFYRTLDWLIKGKDKIEEEISWWVKKLFPVDIVFYDLTNIQFEGSGPNSARIGYPRLGKRNHKQLLLGIVMIEGLPVAHYLFRGNRAEKTTLLWVAQRVKKVHNIGKVVFVFDRGLVNVENLEQLNDGYIAAVKRRRNNEVKSLLEDDSIHYERIKENLFAAEAPLGSDGKRRIICVNTGRREEEKRKREAIILELEGELNGLKMRVESGKLKNVKPIVTSCEEILRKKHGKRYFNYEVKRGYFQFSRKEDGISFEEKLDGKFILTTGEGDLPLEEIVLRYKDLMEVERAFRILKDFIQISPIYHYKDRRVKAHVFVCVLALLLERYLDKRLSDAKIKISSEKAIEKLKEVKVVINQVGGLSLKYVTPPSRELSQILAACGIWKLPKLLDDVTKIRQK